jgi:putative endonuclease
MSDDLRHRMIQHKRGTFDGFTKKYKINRLMYYEIFNNHIAAADREKRIKNYRREKKIALFKDSNPKWVDLTPQILGYLK